MSSAPKPNPADEDFKRIEALVEDLKEKLERAKSCSDEEFKAAYAALVAAKTKLSSATSPAEIRRVVQIDTKLADHAKDVIDQYRRGFPIDGFTIQSSDEENDMDAGMCASCRGRLDLSNEEDVATCTTKGCEKQLCIKCYRLFKSALGAESEHAESPQKKRRLGEEGKDDENDCEDEDKEAYKCTKCLLGEVEERFTPDDIPKVLHFLDKQGVLTDGLIRDAREASHLFSPDERYSAGFEFAPREKVGTVKFKRGTKVYHVFDMM